MSAESFNVSGFGHCLLRITPSGFKGWVGSLAMALNDRS